MWTTRAGVERCCGLNNLGTAEGTLTNTESNSYRRESATTPTSTATSTPTMTASGKDDTTSPTTTATVTPASPPYCYELVFATPLRFGNAKQKLTVLEDGSTANNYLFLDVRNPTQSECEAQCNAVLQCKGIYWFVPKRYPDQLRCYGLENPATNYTKQITNEGYSLLRKDNNGENCISSAEGVRQAPDDLKLAATTTHATFSPVLGVAILVVGSLAVAALLYRSGAMGPPRKPVSAPLSSHFYPSGTSYPPFLIAGIGDLPATVADDTAAVVLPEHYYPT